MMKSYVAAIALSLLPMSFALAQQSNAPNPAGAADQHRTRPSAVERFKALDTNNDGKLSKAEFVARSEQIFAKIDANNDGAVTQEEMQTAREKRRAAHHKTPGAAGQPAEQKPAVK